MKQEKIRKAADIFADREYEICDIDRDALYKGFIHGAQWRINSVWHDADEVPNRRMSILVHCNNIGYLLCEPDLNEKDYRNFLKQIGAICWAYADDLSPERK